MNLPSSPIVSIAMGSESDLPVMEAAAETLASFGVLFEMRVLSAHRTPAVMTEYARTAHERGLKVIIAGAGGAAHLPGMLAASTPLPVIGVPVPTRHLQGLDSLLSIVQMPGGVPVATVAIGGARNAGLLAVQILATSDRALLEKYITHKRHLIELVEQMDASTRIRGAELQAPKG
ncbi:MAG: 5-(carboxyamino)imidazole ribonucleotide mutase [Rhodothermales bacterium]|nr:5-(carboxyamino)imidazole ribonucleotide mutase [Rhodothermales bacterium]